MNAGSDVVLHTRFLDGPIISQSYPTAKRSINFSALLEAIRIIKKKNPLPSRAVFLTDCKALTQCSVPDRLQSPHSVHTVFLTDCKALTQCIQCS